jgi:C1A family cysteine protease
MIMTMLRICEQGGCGSCWAFSSAAQLESWTAMQNITMDAGNFMDLSEQVGHPGEGTL